MSQRVKKVAVLGAGSMGSQIAALMANSDTNVVLFDIVPEGAEDRNILAKQAIEKLKKRHKLTSEEKLQHMEAANMEDDLDKLQDADWVVECVPENESIKHQTYEKIAPYLKKGAVISSNTSTIPLKELKEGMDVSLKQRLCITHFFNPPHKMALLELVADQDNDTDALQHIKQFADARLGKHIIAAEDTPGFIANRIGMFWMICGMQEAKTHHLSIEMADAIMNGAFGFPKTGIFGLMDFIGLKLIPDIADSMNEYLPEDDAFQRLYDGAPLIQQLLEKGESGFYRKQGDEKQTFDLQSGEYRKAEKPEITIDEDWQAFLLKESDESRFARHVLLNMLSYTAGIAPDIANNICEIDAAMREGYAWEKGPFEIMDRLGADWLCEQLEQRRQPVPTLLQQAKGKGFYRTSESGAKEYLTFSGEFKRIEITEDKWTLELRVAEQEPLLHNESARLWDIGDGIACLEFTKGKLRVMDEHVLEMLRLACDTVAQGYRGLIIGHDGNHFSAGLDLKMVMQIIEQQDWQRLERVIHQGQEMMLRLQRSRFPVVVALSGYVLGGGCELTLHADAAQAHSDTRIGLVETGIGVIPAWGGTTELLFRTLTKHQGHEAGACDALVQLFRQIATAQKSYHAEEGMALGYLNQASRITRNRNRLLPEAKALCLQLAEDYTPVLHAKVHIQVKALHERLEREIEKLKQEDTSLNGYREILLHHLASALSGYEAAKAKGQEGQEEVELSMDEMHASTCKLFVALVQQQETQEMIKEKV